MNQKNNSITTLSDHRLIKVDPTQKDFFDNVLNCTSEDNEIIEFIHCVKEVKKSNLKPFWRPIFDPSYDDYECEIIFEAGQHPAVGHSYNWWRKVVGYSSGVEEKDWKLGTVEQYNTFLVWIVNNLVNSGWQVEKAIYAVKADSKELGHYMDSNNSLNTLETTGSRKVCNVFDLGNTCKFLRSYNEEKYYCLAGGWFQTNGDSYPLADIIMEEQVDLDNEHSVGWLVLE